MSNTCIGRHSIWLTAGAVLTTLLAELLLLSPKALASDWCRYFESQGGHKVNYHDMPVKPAYWIELDSKISEVPTNDYGEPISSTVFGVIYKSVYYLTRFHTWKIQKIEDIEPEDAQLYCLNTEESEPIRAGSSLPWSSVNNCTGDISREIFKYK